MGRTLGPDTNEVAPDDMLERLGKHVSINTFVESLTDCMQVSLFS
jgi:hypothetical protein